MTVPIIADGAAHRSDNLQGALAVAAVLGAMTLVVLDAGLATMAAPEIARAFGATPSAGVLVVTVYQAALAIALLPCGALGERFGHRPVFTGGIALFAAASAFGAAAPSLSWLLAARFGQGLGGAAVMALGIALLRSVLPEQKLGRGIGWNALTVALASAAGPGLGALLLAGAGWRWLFIAGLPLAAAVLLAARTLPAGRRAGSAFDIVSALLNATMVAGLVAGLQRLSQAPAVGIALTALGVLAGAGLLKREWARPAPLLPVDLLRLRPFGLSVAASAACFTGQSAGIVGLPFHFHQAFGLSPFATGLCLTAWPLSVAAAAPLAGRLSERLPAAWLCFAGALVLGGGLALAALWPAGAGLPGVVAAATVCGLGFGLFQTPNNRTLFLAAPAERAGAAGAMQATARITGQTAGALLVGLALAAAPADEASRIAFGAGAALALAAAVLSLLRR